MKGSSARSSSLGQTRKASESDIEGTNGMGSKKMKPPQCPNCTTPVSSDDSRIACSKCEKYVHLKCCSLSAEDTGNMNKVLAYECEQCSQATQQVTLEEIAMEADPAKPETIATLLVRICEEFTQFRAQLQEMRAENDKPIVRLNNDKLKKKLMNVSLQTSNMAPPRKEVSSRRARQKPFDFPGSLRLAGAC